MAPSSSFYGIKIVSAKTTFSHEEDIYNLLKIKKSFLDKSDLKNRLN